MERERRWGEGCVHRTRADRGGFRATEAAANGRRRTVGVLAAILDSRTCSGRIRMHAKSRVVPGGIRMHAKDIVPGGLVPVRMVRRPIGRSAHRLGRRRRRLVPTVPTVPEVQQRDRLRADAARFGRNPPRRALLLDGDAVHRQQGGKDK